MSRLALRGRVVLAAAVVLAVGVAVIGLVLNVLLTQRLLADADAVLQARADAQLATIDLRRGRVVVNEGPYDEALDREAWVFAGSTVVARPPALPAVDRAATRLAHARAGTTTDVDGTVRLLAEPAFATGTRDRIATVVVSVSLTPYEESERTARLATVSFALFVVLAGAAVAWRAVGAGLRPVARMAHEAASYSEHDLSRRFGLGPPRDELTTLAATLDSLLDRLEAGLRREQRLTAEIAHALRTPLTGIRAEAELASFETIVSEVDRMNASIDALLRAARGLGPEAMCDLGEVLAAASGAAAATASERGVTVSVDSPWPACRVGAEAAFVAEMLAPLVENGVRHARSAVRISAAATGTRTVEVRVRDDGPGIALEDGENVFRPGWQTSGGSGAGLGLALARRLARSLGGDVRLGGASAGAEFVVELPATHSGGVQVGRGSLAT